MDTGDPHTLEGLLSWFNPAHVLELAMKEEEINRKMLEGMRTGNYLFTPDTENSYACLTAEEVTFEQFIGDLSDAKNILFGKSMSDPVAIEEELKIVSLLAKKSPVPISIALASGHRATMGDKKGIEFMGALTDPRLSAEVSAYVGGIATALEEPKVAGRIYFPDDKLSLARNDERPLIQAFRESGHVHPVERARLIGVNWPSGKEVDRVFFFGSNLWTNDQLLLENIVKEIEHSSSACRIVSQDPMRVSLAMRGKSVDRGIYKIAHVAQPGKAWEPARPATYEYVIVTTPLPALEITAGTAKDEMGLLLAAFTRGDPLEELRKMGVSFGAQTLYKRVTGIIDGLKETAREAGLRTPEIRTAGDLYRATCRFVSDQEPQVRTASMWYNQHASLKTLDRAVQAVLRKPIPWEQLPDYNVRKELYDHASTAIATNQELGKKFPDVLALVDRWSTITNDYEIEKGRHEYDVQLAKEAAERGIQTVPVFIGVNDAELCIVTSLASASDKPQGALQQHIVEFLKRIGNESSIKFKDRTSHGTHELTAPDPGSPTGLASLVSAIQQYQGREPWNVLGYRLEVLLGQASRWEVMDASKTPARSSLPLIERDYDAEVRPALEHAAREAGIKLPTRDEIGALQSTRDRIYATTSIYFALTLLELADGNERAAYALGATVAQKHDLDVRNARNFCSRKLCSDNDFPAVFISRREGKGYLVKLNPDYLKQIALSAPTGSSTGSAAADSSSPATSATIAPSA